MEEPKIVPLGSLRLGDIYHFATDTDRKLLPGERLPVWKVDSIGDERCGVILQRIGDTEALHSFSASPLMLASKTLVVRLPDQPTKR